MGGIGPGFVGRCNGPCWVIGFWRQLRKQLMWDVESMGRINEVWKRKRVTEKELEKETRRESLEENKVVQASMVGSYQRQKAVSTSPHSKPLSVAFRNMTSETQPPNPPGRPSQRRLQDGNRQMRLFHRCGSNNIIAPKIQPNENRQTRGYFQSSKWHRNAAQHSPLEGAQSSAPAG